MLPLSRREMMKISTLGLGAMSGSGWMNVLARAASSDAPRTGTGRRAKQCILLWMDGGPSQHDTFDMKPDAPDNIRGPFRPIASSVPGIQITEMFPRIAPLMHHSAILRGMTTAESEHGRARLYLHTGYRAGAGGLRYPTMGSLVTAAGQEAGQFETASEMPNFVVTGAHLNPANWSYVSSPGFLGPRHAPLIVADPTGGIANIRSPQSDEEFETRNTLAQRMAQSFLREYPDSAASAHQTTMQRALQLMRSNKARAFDLTQEPERVRQRYGNFTYGQGCLLARRLIEAGVPFVEVYHSPTAGGWDNHTGARTREVYQLAMPQCDQATSALLTDLHERGLLEETLVIWMGEFGRTPRVSSDGGRDHYARAWTSVLFGGGVQGGQVVGRTDAMGGIVEDRPITAIDFMATVCHIMGIDGEHTFHAGDRPVRMIDRGANPVTEIL